MPVPIIMPIVIPIEKECIIQDGIKYCETGDVSMQIVSIGFIMAMLWAGLIGWLLLEKDNTWAAIGVLLAPFILMAIFGG